MSRESLLESFKPKIFRVNKEEMALLLEYDLKWCGKCQSVKDISKFGIDKHKRDGHTAKCLECNRKQCSTYNSNNSNKIKIRKEEYKDKYPDNYKAIRKRSHINCREQERNYSNNKYKTDPIFKMQVTCRNMLKRIYEEFSSIKSNRTHKVLGYSALNLKEHIEKQFIENMTWENYGDWHIDHIIPISKASNLREGIILSQLSNLQPLWAEDNLKKSNTIK